MNTIDISQIKAVAFDIDGTLYRTWRFNLRLFPYFLSHLCFFAKYGLARKALRIDSNKTDFIKAQSEDMAKRLHCTPEEANKRLEKIVYTGIEKYFVNLPPCEGAVEFIKQLKEAGYKIGILSDFPPEQKGNIWGIKDLCDVCLGTETTGALKPSTIPFIALSKQLQVEPEQILYVGNSHKYDVIGANNAGMKTAWITTSKNKKSDIADITFVHYKELYKLFFDNTSVQKP